ncbi:Hpt domain-containing protein [Alteromonas oceanisediminis]|uniref:Hpt domain-containing protein n=1 Tax=Alteromonas oceanisediminis TaxID=2836180 RepID=UPI001BD9AB3F|nr:Hpt domain-containing protein [Alteromonas oceanisediminis]MBT0584834.1 Hpt domain-containing protein [Alteromonas oceanisediminis]
MENQALLVDLDFGTKQLGGNTALFVKLLGRFEDEYQDAESKLAEFQQHNNLETMQLLVHTIKGVSGNLGLERLAKEAKKVEALVKRDSLDDESLQTLIHTLNQTLTEIQAVRNQHTRSSDENTRHVAQTHSGEHVEALTKALQQQRFISDELFDNATAQSNLSQADKEALQSAILDLDYPRALAILGES